MSLVSQNCIIHFKWWMWWNWNCERAFKIWTTAHCYKNYENSVNLILNLLSRKLNDFVGAVSCLWSNNERLWALSLSIWRLKDIYSFCNNVISRFKQMKPYSKMEHHLILDVIYLRQYLGETFPRKYVDRTEENNWMTSSPYLTPLDFFLSFEKSDLCQQAVEELENP
jgi:hypothetical protein